MKLIKKIYVLMVLFVGALKMQASVPGPANLNQTSAPTQITPQNVQAHLNQLLAAAQNQYNAIILQLQSKILFLAMLKITGAGAFTSEQLAQALSTLPQNELSQLITLFQSMVPDVQRPVVLATLGQKPFPVNHVAYFQQFLAAVPVVSLSVEQVFALNTTLQTLMSYLEVVQRATLFKQQEEQKTQAAAQQHPVQQIPAQQIGFHTVSFNSNPVVFKNISKWEEAQRAKQAKNQAPPAAQRPPLAQQLSTTQNQNVAGAGSCGKPHSAMGAEPKRLAASKGQQITVQAQKMFDELYIKNQKDMESMPIANAEVFIQNYENQLRIFHKFIADNINIAHIIPFFNNVSTQATFKQWADQGFSERLVNLKKSLEDKIMKKNAAEKFAAQKEAEQHAATATLLQSPEAKIAAEQFKELFALYSDTIPEKMNALETGLKIGEISALESLYNQIVQIVAAFAQKLALFQKYIFENQAVGNIILPPVASSLAEWAVVDGGFDHALKDYQYRLAHLKPENEDIQKKISNFLAIIAGYIPHFVDNQYLAPIILSQDEIDFKKLNQKQKAEPISATTTIGSVAYKIANAFKHISALLQQLYQTGNQAQAKDLAKNVLSVLDNFERFFNPATKVFKHVQSTLIPAHMAEIQSNLATAKKYLIEASK